MSDPLGVVSSLVTPTGSNPVLLLEGTWYPLNAEFSGDALPADLSELVQSGQPARMRFRYNDETELAVGVPLESVNGAYFEIVSLNELEDDARVDQHLVAGGGPDRHPGGGGAGLVGRPAGAAAAGRDRRSGCTPWPPGGSTPASRPAPTPTWRRWPTRSTRWPTPSRNGSSATPGSHPT